MNYNFNLLSKSQKTINYVNKILVNYPKKELVLKNNIESTMYAMIECIFAYVINQSTRIREKYLKDFLIKLSMLDFYVNVSYEKKILGKRQYEVIGRSLVEIRKIAYGVIKSEIGS